jgi:hypothetical protein
MSTSKSNNVNKNVNSDKPSEYSLLKSYELGFIEGRLAEAKICEKIQRHDWQKHKLVKKMLKQGKIIY